MTWEKEEFVLTDNEDDQDVDAILALLQSTYWAGDRTKEQMKKILEYSLCFSLSKGEVLIGFVRVISDCTKMSWISDMVVRDEYRGRQLGQWMMEVVLDHPLLKQTQFALQTKDAHSFYAKLGFSQRPSLMSTSASYL